MSDKPTIAFFDFTCCEGCQLTVLGLGERLVEILEYADVVAWREAISEKSDRYDIAIVEGSICRDSDIPRLRHIRRQADVLIALGACAALGGVQALGNNFDPAEMLKAVFGDQADHFEAGKVRPLCDIVQVDYTIHGCPINPEEFLAVVKHVLLGRPYRIPNEPVCMECKFRQNECLYDVGKICLGPVTRCGCGAICVSSGHRCFGCRGLVDDPNLNAAREVLEEHGYGLEEIVAMFEVYWQPASVQEIIQEQRP